MKLKQKMMALVCAAAMAASLTACGSGSGTDYSDQTLVGKITSIDGTSVTIQLGTLSDGTGSTDTGDTTTDSAGSGESADNSEQSAGSGESADSSAQSADSGESADSSAQSADSTQGTASAQNDTASDSTQNTPPEKPEGDASASGDSTQSTPPEKPDGDSATGDSTTGDSTAANGSDGAAANTTDGNAQQGGTPPDMQSSDMGGTGGMGDMSSMGGMEQSVTFTAGDDTATIDLKNAVVTEESTGADTRISTDDLEEGDVIVIEIDSDNTAEYVVVRNTGESGGESGSVEQGSAANTIDEDGTYSDETYTSDGDDENALRVDGAEATLDGVTVEKTGGETSNTENGDFYGVNAGLLATNGANVTIKNATVTTDAQNGNGVFSYGEGTTVTISDSEITTSKDNSGGIQTTGGGTTNASNLTVQTAGNSSAAIRSDRGGGTVNVDGGTYTSNGYNSPAVYSTADITVKNATLTATNSEALVIEGENSIALTDCDVSGNMSDTESASSDINVHNVMIYQSMSGDAEEGTASFSMTGGSLTGKNGDLFFITNTACTLSLSGVTVSNEDEDGTLMTVAGNNANNGWGTAGSNGAQVTATMTDQTLAGTINVDTISTLNLTLSGSSDFTGTINIVDNAEGGTAVENNAVITVEAGSTWTLTGDCTITSLTNNGTINFNGYTITLADGTVLSE